MNAEASQDTKRHVLVVCTAGQHRSPTAARLLNERFDIDARACGIHPQAKQSVTQELIDWSNHIIAMDERTDGHKSYLEDRFDTGDRSVFIFDIPDVYGKDDPELIDLLEDKLAAFIERLESEEVA
jgi:predicted protein tyrosine phosphatase